MNSYDQVFLFYKSFSLEYLEYNFGNFEFCLLIKEIYISMVIINSILNYYFERR